MADDQDPGAISTTFPIPPPFYKHFTEENRQRLQDLTGSTSDASLNSKQKQELDTHQQLPEVPAELRFLVPPPPPKDGRYISFGARYNV